MQRFTPAAVQQAQLQQEVNVKPASGVKNAERRAMFPHRCADAEDDLSPGVSPYVARRFERIRAIRAAMSRLTIQNEARLHALNPIGESI